MNRKIKVANCKALGERLLLTAALLTTVAVKLV